MQKKKNDFHPTDSMNRLGKILMLPVQLFSGLLS